MWIIYKPDRPRLTLIDFFNHRQGDCKLFVQWFSFDTLFIIEAAYAILQQIFLITGAPAGDPGEEYKTPGDDILYYP